MVKIQPWVMRGFASRELLHLAGFKTTVVISVDSFSLSLYCISNDQKNVENLDFSVSNCDNGSAADAMPIIGKVQSVVPI